MSEFKEEVNKVIKEGKQFKKPLEEAFKEKVVRLLEEIVQKWGVAIAVGKKGELTYSDFYYKVRKLPRVAYRLPDGTPVDFPFPVDSWLRLTLPDGTPGEVLPYIEGEDLEEPTSLLCSVQPDELPIAINLSVIDSRDIKEIQREVGKLVKEELTKRKGKKKGWEPSHPLHIEQELGFIYHIKDETFQRYLKWYDLHTREKLSLRWIAHLERMSSRVREEVLERLKSKAKIPKWGKDIEGEDAVQKGVHLIYKAIHRKEYKPYEVKPEIEPEIEVYSCPFHGTDCPKDCDYILKWLRKFDKRYPPELPPDTTLELKNG